MKKEEHSFERIREDVEAGQRSTVWPDTVRNGSSVDAFLWKGDPHAKPIQRAGLIVFAFMFLFFAIVIASLAFQKGFGDGWKIDLIMALPALLISMRLFRNAFLRPPKHPVHSAASEQNDCRPKNEE